MGSVSVLFLDPGSLNEQKWEKLLKRNEKQMALATMLGSTYEIPYGARGGGFLLKSSTVDLSDIGMAGLIYNERTNCYSFNLS